MTLTCTNVTLRQKPLRNDRISLYLDYYPAIRNPYTMKMSRREFLGIYIYAKPKNEQQRMFNQDMLNKAEAIRCIRVQSLINEEFGFLDKNKQKVDFLAYFRTKAREKYEKWDCVYNHFEKFVGGKCTFGDVTVELCEKFRDYLLKCKQINHPNAYISRNSAAGYYSTFRALLKIAYKEKMLRENLNDFLEKIEWKEVKKEYLTLDEVKKLAATPCKIPVLKRPSLGLSIHKNPLILSLLCSSAKRGTIGTTNVDRYLRGQHFLRIIFSNIENLLFGNQLFCKRVFL